MNDNSLNILRRKIPNRIKITYIILILSVAVLSSFADIDYSSITAEHPGGVMLEIAFWVTSAASAFLTFIMTDVLFRSRESRLLSPFPVEPIRLFDYQMRRVFRGIGALSIVYAGAWAPHACFAPLPLTAAIAMFPVGLCICAVVSAAILMHIGNRVSQARETAQSDAMAFGTAPAIALAVTLALNLMLKLLAEALLKPDFMDAALTALTVVAATSAAAWAYARIMFKRRYYAAYAAFQDLDGIVINGDYAFLDGKCAAQMLKLPLKKALALGWSEQFRRRHGMANPVTAMFAVIWGIYLSQSPEALSQLCLPCVAAVALLLFSRPWLALFERDICAGAFDAFAIGEDLLTQSRLISCMRISAFPIAALSLCFGAPAGFVSGWGTGAATAAQVAAVSCIVAFGMSLAAQRIRNYSNIAKLNYLCAGVFLIAAVVL